MSGQVMSAESSLWFVASCLQAEEALEIGRHWEHDCYAGALVMQELILALYPELEIPVQRSGERQTAA